MADKSSARRVEAAPFEPPSPDNQPQPQKFKTQWPYVIAAALLLVLIPSIFKVVDLLGSNVESEVVVYGLDSASSENGAIAGEEPIDAPFEDALLAEARSKAQDILSELLPLRRDLEARRAAEWAAESFAELVELALEGDELYQSREFEPALIQYQQSLSLAREIEADTAQSAESFRRDGYIALEERNADEARHAFELAVAIEEDNEEGQIGLKRAQVLPQIRALLAEADNLVQQSLLEQAKEKVEASITLDSDDPESQQMLVYIGAEILRRDFQAYMSNGFQQLAQGNFQDAENAFRSAQTLEPDNDAVSDALDQVEATRESDRSAQILQQARIAEESESWSTARDRYNQLLKEDPNRVEARIALVKVDARLNLENQILQHLENPLRLKEESIWRDAENTLGQAQTIANPGPVLRGQVDQLAEILRKARTPVRLEVVSDGATQVSILGVSDLGQIRSHPLDLNPGIYVVIGKKRGFQDIRQEIVLTGDESRVVVDVIPNRSVGSF